MSKVLVRIADALCSIVLELRRLNEGRDQWYREVLEVLTQSKDLEGSPAGSGQPAAAPDGQGPCSCNGGWSIDENYQPEDYEANDPLRPEKGLIPCGLCNHGGWDAPWPPATSQREGEDGERPSRG